MQPSTLRKAKTPSGQEDNIRTDREEGKDTIRTSVFLFISILIKVNESRPAGSLFGPEDCSIPQELEKAREASFLVFKIYIKSTKYDQLDVLSKTYYTRN